MIASPESRRRVIALLAVGLVAHLAACASEGDPSRHMAVAAATRVAAPEPGRASVVFVRDEDSAHRVHFAILDADEGWLGDASAGSYFVASVKPGRHLFVSWAEDTDAVQADVEAGRTYFVLSQATMGFWAPAANLLAVRPGSERWAELPALLAQARRLDPNVEGGRRYLQESKPNATPNRIRRGREFWETLAAEKRAERTLRPDDGVTAWPAADGAR